MKVRYNQKVSTIKLTRKEKTHSLSIRIKKNIKEEGKYMK